MGEALSLPEGAAEDHVHGFGSGVSMNGAACPPREGVLLSQLIQLLSQRARHSLALYELDAMLPGQLRQLAKDHGGLRAWLLRYKTLFVVGGLPGKEEVTLILGGSHASHYPGAATGGGDAPQFAATGLAPEPWAAGSGHSPPPMPPPPQPLSLTAATAMEPSPSTPRPRTAGAAAAGTAAAEALAVAAAEAVAQAKAAAAAKAGGLPDLEARGDSHAGGFFDEETDGQSALQLRGLPYRATVEDVAAFLGEHAANLAGEPPIFLVLNRDGRPSGFARVSFTSPEAAKRCRDDLHCQMMDDRYVEVFLYAERPSRGRQRRGLQEEGVLAEAGRGPPACTAAEAAGVTREQVVRECRSQMAEPKKRCMLLSMLGVALSPGARSYVKQMDGLKHFLAQFSSEFSVEGSKGSEFVTYTPMQLSEAIDGLGLGTIERGAATTPSTATPTPTCSRAVGSSAIPRTSYGSQDDFLTSPKPSPTPLSMNPTPSAGRGWKTPSDWGTPLPVPGANPWPPGPAGWMPPWPTGLPGVPCPLPGAGVAAAADGGGGCGAGGASGCGVSGVSGGGGGSAAGDAAAASAAAAALGAVAAAWAPPPAWPIQPPQFWPGWPGSFPPPWGLPTSAAPTAPAEETTSVGGEHVDALGPHLLPGVQADQGLAVDLAPASGGVLPKAAPLPPVGDGRPAKGAVATPASDAGGKAAAPCAANLSRDPQGNTQSNTFGSFFGCTLPTGGSYSTAVRLRGLPFSASAQDVLAFFAQHDIVDRVSDGPNAVTLLVRSNGKPSGQAVVQMRGRPDAELAQRVLGGQWMGSRYIEVFLYGEDGVSEGPNNAAVFAATQAPQKVPTAGQSQGAGAPAQPGSTQPQATSGDSAAAAAAAAAAQQVVAAQQAVAAQQVVAAAAAAAAFQALPPWPPPWTVPLQPPSGMNLPGMGMTVPAGVMGGDATQSWEALFEFLGPEERGDKRQ